MLTSLEHWVLEESAPTEYSYPSSDVAWVSRWQAYGYLRVTRRKNSHIIYFVTGYRSQNLFNLGERAYCYFYHFALIIIMSKRLTLPPTANFASQHLWLHSSLGYVQPCTVYHCLFCLESTVDKPHQRQAPKLMLRCRVFWVSKYRWAPVWILYNKLRMTPQHSFLYQDGNRLRWEDAEICGLTAVI